MHACEGCGKPFGHEPFTNPIPEWNGKTYCCRECLRLNLMGAIMHYLSDRPVATGPFQDHACRHCDD